MAAEEEKRNRRHGSTAFFVAVDYLFLLIFLAFLGYLVLSQIWPRSAPIRI